MPAGSYELCVMGWLYRSFSENGNPTLKTTLAVMKALGIELTAKVAAASA